jgi:hypothetical protein
MKESKDSLRDLHYVEYVQYVCIRRKREREKVNIIKEIIVQNFSSLGKDIELHIQEVQ